MSTLDIIVLSILAISFIVGFVKGFLRTLLGLVAFFVAAALALYISPKISDMVTEKTAFDEMISEKAQELLSLDELPLQSMDSLNEQLAILNSMDMPGALRQELLDNNNDKIYEMLQVDNIGDYIGKFLAMMAINVLSYIFVFTLAMILLGIAVDILDLATRLPILHEINKLAGAGLGLLLGLASIWTFLAVYNFVLSFQSMESLTALIETSTFAKFLYNNNPLMWYMTRI